MPTRPICFMITPYSVKPTLQKPGSTAPEKVDYDRLWNAAFRPAIEELGYDPVRADQDLGALIITEMIERLAISDLVIADVSIANGNVYYEVGIRHAAVKNGCVMTAADWAEPLFDIDQMRQIRYPLPEQSISDETAQKIIGILKEGVPKLRDGESPFYQVLPGFPSNVDMNRTTAFRKSLQELSEFQSELTAARTTVGKDECRTRTLAVRDKYYGTGPVRKVVALELLYALRDCTDWPTTLQFINSLPADIQQMPVVQEQKALAQSKDGNHETAIGGLLELIKAGGDTSERRGLLGGRYKKLWQAENDERKKRQLLDKSIEQYELGMKLDLNDYYPSSNLPRLYRVRERRGDDDKARVAASITMVACERSRSLRKGDEWLKPTLLGAAFDAGDVEKARDLADEVRTEGPAAWKLDTTLNDLKVSTSLQDEERRPEFEAIVADLESLIA